MRKLATIALVLAAAVGFTLAQEKIDKRVSAARDGVVTIENIAGSVTVTGWDRDEVEVTGTLGRGTRELVFKNSGNETTIRVELPEHARNVDGSDLMIQVPRSSRLEIEVVSANVSLSDVSGPIDVSSVSGEVEASGDVRSAEISTVSSTIRFRTNGLLENGEFNSVSGKIDVAADLDSSGRFKFETVSGAIDLRVPRNVSASFDISSFSGSIRNEFGPEPSRRNEHLPSQELRFSNGGGGARVSVETLSGPVRLMEE